MSENKPLASLSSGLLARKGAARPAMRRQNIMSASPPSPSAQDDLGWNDMGYDVDPPQNAEPVAVSPDGEIEGERKTGGLSAAIPEVVKQQDALKRNFAAGKNANGDSDIAHSESPKSEMFGSKPFGDGSPGADASAGFSAASETKSSVAQAVDSPASIQLPIPDQPSAEKASVVDDDEGIAQIAKSPLWSKPGADKKAEAPPLERNISVDPPLPETIAEPEQPAIAEVRSVLSQKPAKIQAKVQAKVDAKTKHVERSKALPAAKTVRKRANSKAKATSGKRAAFTLRLDAQRHLRLRLACAIRNQSAQNMVTHALDEFLAGFPELDAMTGSLPDLDGPANKTN